MVEHHSCWRLAVERFARMFRTASSVSSRDQAVPGRQKSRANDSRAILSRRAPNGTQEHERQQLPDPFTYTNKVPVAAMSHGERCREWPGPPVFCRASGRRQRSGNPMYVQLATEADDAGAEDARITG